jgi:hypothetical protein
MVIFFSFFVAGAFTGLFIVMTNLPESVTTEEPSPIVRQTFDIEQGEIRVEYNSKYYEKVELIEKNGEIEFDIEAVSGAIPDGIDGRIEVYYIDEEGFLSKKTIIDEEDLKEATREPPGPVESGNTFETVDTLDTSFLDDSFSTNNSDVLSENYLGDDISPEDIAEPYYNEGTGDMITDYEQVEKLVIS